MKKIVSLSLLVVLLAIIGSAGAVFYTVFFGGESIAVPPMVGTSVLDAVSMAEKMGLAVRVDQEESLEPRGTVIAQWPQAGVKVRSEKVLILKVSKGGYKKALPDLRSMEFSQAASKLSEMEFALGDVIRVENAKPAGMVIAQNPAAPVMVSRTRPVGLLVSMGPHKDERGVAVPDVLGKDEESARKLVAESGLSVSVEYAYTQASPPGMAIALSPKAGTKVPEGSFVVVKVSTMKRDDEPEDQRTQADSDLAVILPGVRPDTAPVVPPQPSSAGARVVVIKPGTPPAPPAGQVPVLPAPAPALDLIPAPAPVPVMIPSSEQPVPSVPGQGAPAAPEKKAKIRYQVPPLTKPLSLKIEIIDKSGMRPLISQEVSGGEYISLDAPYQGEAAVTIFLGGEFVWQDKYR